MDVVNEYQIQCPQCGELFGIAIDTSQGDHATIEDCAICCRPLNLDVECAPGEVIQVHISPA